MKQFLEVLRQAEPETAYSSVWLNLRSRTEAEDKVLVEVAGEPVWMGDSKDKPDMPLFVRRFTFGVEGVTLLPADV